MLHVPIYFSKININNIVSQYKSISLRHQRKQCLEMILHSSPHQTPLHAEIHRIYKLKLINKEQSKT